jgi:hypothetical protein
MAGDISKAIYWVLQDILFLNIQRTARYRKLKKLRNIARLNGNVNMVCGLNSTCITEKCLRNVA